MGTILGFLSVVGPFLPFGFLVIAFMAWFRDWPRRKTYAWLAGWWVVVLVQNSWMGRDDAGMLQFWLVFGSIGLVAIGYGEGVRAVQRRKVGKPVAAPATGTFREAELDRYARHIILREIGGPGQKRL